MNIIQITILFMVVIPMFVYSFRCQLILWDLLVKHGKRPASFIFSSALLNHIKLTKELLAELDDESQIKELKAALSRADKSVFLTIVIFLALGGVFLSMGM